MLSVCVPSPRGEVWQGYSYNSSHDTANNELGNGGRGGKYSSPNNHDGAASDEHFATTKAFPDQERSDRTHNTANL
jgi:hypothetical protein